jgi:glycosyltransferase involved in cell wall biosynthesis
LFSWSSYTNAFTLALIDRNVCRVGSFRNAAFSDLPRRMRWIWSRMSMARISTIVCNSQETQKQVAQRCGSGARVVYVPNAVQVFSEEQVMAWRKVWRAKLKLEDGRVLLMGVGRLAPQKQFSRFLEVIAQVKPHAPIHAVIAGRDHGCLNDLQHQADALGLQGVIQFAGEIPDAREIICAADIFLLTSDHEGMPNVVLEAMAAGVPSVATDVNGVRDLIQHGENGFIAERDADDLVRYTIPLAQDINWRRTVGARARLAIEHLYQPQHIARQLWALCDDA